MMRSANPVPSLSALLGITASVCALIVAAEAMSAPALVAASEPTAIIRTVKGEVIAVNVSDFPQVIVVKAMTAKKQELIVGAIVESGVVITRGTQRVSLSDIKVGESVELTYLKNPDGLAARSIHVR